MQKRIRIALIGLVCCVLLFLSAAGCKPELPTSTAASSAISSTPTILVEPPTPSSSPTPAPTAVPLAARVDGYEITLSEYQAELKLYLDSKNADLTPEDEKQVIDDLIDKSLLANGAEKSGFTLDSTKIEERVNSLINHLGSAQALEKWQANYGYDDFTFRKELSRSIAAAWMRDQIAAEVPKTVEQVHVRQILLYNSDQAGEIYKQLLAGNSFENLAQKYDPITGGDLGWFPRGYLPDKEIEDAAFSLQLEQYSSIIKTVAGYHILQLLERDPARPLAPDALLALQKQAVADWLEQQREASTIEILLH